MVARVSDYIGFDLPVTFPYYQGAMQAGRSKIRWGRQIHRRNGSCNIES
jgi:hypothetical protein